MRSAASLLLLVLALGAGCANETQESGPEQNPEPRPLAKADAVPDVSETDAASRADPPEAQTVFDAAEVVFDTLEPLYRPRVEIPEPPPPPRRRPPPRPRPLPVPVPEPLPPPSPAPPVAGSCDVRASENFCFAYTGATWTAATAEQHCSEAPDSDFSAAECPTEGRIATCVFRRGEAPARQIVYTYYEPYDLNLARIACPGRFTESR